MTPFRFLGFAVFLSAFFAATVRGQDSATDIETRLAGLPRVWEKRIPKLTEEVYEASLAYWAETFPDRVTHEIIGHTLGGRPLHQLIITDTSVDDRDKQVCFVTALHGGPERTGTTTALHAIEWLLSDDPEAAETRRRQIIVVIPIINPEAFFDTDRFRNREGIDPYTGGGPEHWDLENLTYQSGEKAPGVKAFLEQIDRFRPEVHLDLHGTGLQEYRPDQLGDRTRYRGQTMFEITGSAYSNYALRPWDWRVTEAMIVAGEEAGFPSDRYEADAQRAYWGPALQPITPLTWRGRPNFYTAQMAYARYHTMLAALEIGWETSGLARLKGMLRVGNGVWPSENRSGYSVDRVRSFTGHFVTTWGHNAAERRDSRVELWRRQPEFTQAILYPQTEGRDTYFVALGKEAAVFFDGEPSALVEGLRDKTEIDAGSLEKFFDFGPEIQVAVDRAPKLDVESAPIERGIGFRLRIPYREPEIVDVRLNGHALSPSPTDGYESFSGNGYTQLQVNVPPEKAKRWKLFLVTCAYRPDVAREYGWEPPTAVRERLSKGTR
ncbi:MAG: hypothetical protein KDN19_06230 [Verrucomicrobiae bacterium]|nr:hypothetical protein [Verrucomicrobiae bacterium]